MSRRFAPTSLMLGNFIIGTSVLAPTGMLAELASGLHIEVRRAGLLVTFGALVMCIGSPLLSWASSRADRRILLGGSLAVIALTHVSSAYATSFGELLALRLLMVAAAAPFTPQAASVSALLVPLEKRASTISYVFLGWSLAAAFGIPMVTFVASRLGYQGAYNAIGALALLSALFLFWRLPSGLQTQPLVSSSWGELAKSALVRKLLLLTAFMTAGQFLVFTFLAPLLVSLTNVSADGVGLAFAVTGFMGFVGNLIASRIVGTRGPYRTELLSTGALTVGSLLFATGAGTLATMVVGLAVWGLGFASTNSMQQARLVAAAPALASASVALNTSSIYVGQATGSAIGGALFASGHAAAMGYGAFAFILLGVAVLRWTRPA